MKLRYVDTDEPGISRRRCGSGFVYVRPNGALVKDARDKRRIEKLAVPPAWARVWLCRDGIGHIQAMGCDARRRRQYIYHAQWRELQDLGKFDQLAELGAALPRIRARVDRDIRSAKIDEAAILAAAVRILDATGIRTGNSSYFHTNGTVGLTTLQNRHVTIKGTQIALRFSAKGGRKTALAVDDRKLAKLLLKCEDLPGQRLLRYRCGDQMHDLDSTQLNEYLRNLAGGPVTAKHFRTWIATVTVIEAWLETEDRPLAIGEATKRAAKALCNTPAVTRRSYIHPKILQIATVRTPDPSERAVGGRAAGRLSGAERLCRQLLRKR